MQIFMSSTRLLLVNSDQLEVDGLIDDVQKQLQNAARSSPGTLARLTETGSGESVGVNPEHVLTIRPGDE
jgi:hypothetical protein